MLNETINILNDLNLYGLKNSISNEIDYITNNNLPFLEGLNHFLKNELKYREINRAEANIKVAHFPYIKEIKDFDFDYQPSINKDVINDLATLRFIEEKKNVLFIGNPGVGKTHLAVALGIEAARHRNSVYFITCHNLMLKLNKAQKENRLDKQLQHLAQYKVLIIDEIGYLPVDHQGSNLLFQLIAKRYMNKSTIVTTNMPFSRWGEVFSDNTLASALLDRLLHYSHIIRITGNSYRIKDKIVETDSRTNEYNE